MFFRYIFPLVAFFPSTDWRLGEHNTRRLIASGFPLLLPGRLRSKEIISGPLQDVPMWIITVYCFDCRIINDPPLTHNNTQGKKSSDGKTDSHTVDRNKYFDQASVRHFDCKYFNQKCTLIVICLVKEILKSILVR